MSNPFAGPLPLLPGSPAGSRTGLPGWWRGFVERTDPLGVSVPALTGQGSVSPGTVEQVPGLTLAVGDRVWVVCIDGHRTALLITALRE